MNGEGGVMVAGYDRVLLEEARACLERSERGARKDDATLHAGAAASAIVAACAAAEAFVSERATYHRHKGSLSEEQADDIRRADGLHRKLNTLVKCFHPDGLDDHPAYPAFCALVKLRGCIVHRSARFLDTEDWPEDLQGQEGVIRHLERPGLDWTSRVLNKVTAEWAVETAERILSEAAGHVPENPKGINVAISPVEFSMDGKDLTAEKPTVEAQPKNFERSVQWLLVAAVVVVALALFVDWSNVWAAVRPILDFLLQ